MSLLAIFSFLEKLFDKIIGPLLSFWIRRSDASKKKRDKEQNNMDIAAKEGDFNAWKNARSRRNRA